MIKSTKLSPSLARQSRIALAVTLVLLGAISVDRFVFARPTAAAEAYHERLRETAARLPSHFDRWLGVDAPVPQSAITMLKPNFIISRNYNELGGRRSAMLLVVHCRDSRDILGHYPPVCYVNQGWAMESATPKDWETDGGKIAGMRYVFSTNRGGSKQELVLDNFMVLPDGQTARGMDEVDRAARDSTLKHFGAAQVQLVYNASLTEADRSEIFSAFMRQLRPVLDAILKTRRDPPVES